MKKSQTIKSRLGKIFNIFIFVVFLGFILHFQHELKRQNNLINRLSEKVKEFAPEATESPKNAFKWKQILNYSEKESSGNIKLVEVPIEEFFKEGKPELSENDLLIHWFEEEIIAGAKKTFIEFFDEINLHEK